MIFYQISIFFVQPDYSLLRSRAKCYSAFEGKTLKIDHPPSIENCSQACQAKKNCRFFIFNEKDGKCIVHEASNAKCQVNNTGDMPHAYENWKDDEYNFYEIKSNYLTAQNYIYI